MGGSVNINPIFLCPAALGILIGYAQAQSQQSVPTKTIEFKAVESDSNFSLPPVTNGLPHCNSDGALVLDAMDAGSLNKRAEDAAARKPLTAVQYTLITIRGRTIQTVSSSAISDLNDLFVLDVFPADSGLYFLVRGSKEHAGERGRGKSPTGIPWSSYRNYIARFDADGVYKGVTEIQAGCDMLQPGHCEVSHLAVLPSGDFLVTESDPVTSTLRLLYLNLSGEVLKQIDVPAGRKPIDWGGRDSNPAILQEAKNFLASVLFTAFDQSILVWRSNSNDPILEIRAGGGVREVPLQTPQGFRFVNMITSNDRWVAHFRNDETPPDARMSEETDTYYEIRPQDGSLVARLVQKGDVPRSIACESSGTYTAFKMSDLGKLVLLKAN
jgi:hypothetical protein